MTILSKLIHSTFLNHNQQGKFKMSKEEKKGKDVKAVVSMEVWKKLKILSIQKDLSFPEMVTLALEAFVAKKKFDGEENT
jgi:hypothetical protein